MSKNFWNSLVIAAAIVIPTMAVGGLEAKAQSYGAIARSPSTQDNGIFVLVAQRKTEQ